MFREFKFYDPLAIHDYYGKKIVDYGEGRGFTISHQQIPKGGYEVSITDCIPDNLRVEIVTQDDGDKVEELAPNKYSVSKAERCFHFNVLLKYTKLFKKFEPVIPLQALKESSTLFEEKLLKSIKYGEVAECQFQPFEGVVIDAKITNSYHYEVSLTSKTHVLEFPGDPSYSNDCVRFSYVPGKTSPSAACNAEESTAALTIALNLTNDDKGPALTLNIYEKKICVQYKIDAHGATDVHLKTSDKKVVKVHKKHLIAKSTVFAVLLNANSDIPYEIDVNHDSETVFRAMTYVYDETLEIKGFEPECYKFTEEFGMPELKELCLDSMKQMTGKKFHHKYFTFAQTHNLEWLKQKYFAQHKSYRNPDAKEFADSSAPVL